MTSASTPAIGIPTPAGGGASSLIGSTSAAPAVSNANAAPSFTMPSTGAAPSTSSAVSIAARAVSNAASDVTMPSTGAACSTSSAVSNATPSFTMRSCGAPAAAAPRPPTTVTASAGFSTSSVASTSPATTTAAVAPVPSMFPSTAGSSSPFSTTTTPALSTPSMFPSCFYVPTVARLTQTSAPASTSSSTYSFGIPISTPLRFGGAAGRLPNRAPAMPPVSSRSRGATGRLPNRAPAKPPVSSRSGGSTGLHSGPAPVKRPVFSRLGGATNSASTVTTTGPVVSASTAPATATASAVTTGLLSSPAPAKPVYSTVTTTTPASPVPGLIPLQAATSASSIPSITSPKQEIVLVEVKAPDFNDFNKDRSETCLAVDQIWAIYDGLDFMPREYVRINKVYSPFKVDVTWLEFVAGSIDETAWKKSGLPVACGKFKYEKSQKTDTIEDMSSFSYKVFKSKKVHESYNIYPRYGETWALYKNWNKRWSSDPDNHREYEYEFVVVLSNYTKSGILVARLVKLKGFVCLFKPTKNNGMDSFRIPSKEMLRFSHRVPSFKTNGKERKDVIPEGYFELDTCSLPSNLEEVSEVVDMEAETVDRNINGSLKFVSEEKPPMLKKRKNPDAESTLDKSSPVVNKASKMSNSCSINSNEEKQAAEASGRPLDKSKAIIVSVGYPNWVCQTAPRSLKWLRGENAAAHPKGMSPDGMITIPGSVDRGIPSAPSFGAAPSASSAVANAARAPSTSSAVSNDPTAAAAAAPFSGMFPSTTALSSPISTTTTSAFASGTGSALLNTTAITQTTAPAPASVARAATSPSTTNSSTFSFRTPSCRFEGATGQLSNPASAKTPVLSGFEGATTFASKVTTTGPLLSASTSPATATSEVMTGPLSSLAPTGFTPTVTTTTPASPAPSLLSSQAVVSPGSAPSITTPKIEPELVVLKVAYPDFYDFDKNRSEKCFEVNQRWAIFDNLDLMPRNYVRIDKLYSPFKVDVTWMEFVTENMDETAWKRSGLPVACGKFKYEKTDTIEDMSSFSHMIFNNKSVHESCIYPRKGETWAVYKNWNIKWSSDPENHREYEYEFVIVLSDYTTESGILVGRLYKLKGFVSLFKPTKNNCRSSFLIPSNELLRFSHRVPSFRTNGKERKDVPEGYFELDTCSLPSNLEEVSGVSDMEAETVTCNNGLSKSESTEKHPTPKKRKNPDAESTLDRSSPGGNKASKISNGCFKNSNEEKRAAEASGRPLDKSKAIIVSVGRENAAAHPKEMSTDGVITIPGNLGQDILSSPSSLKIFEMLDTGFWNFDEERSCHKFKAGQIWALYCKLDKLPKNYAQIASVESFPVFKLAVKWLESCDPPRGIIPWVDKEMPVSCGKFKVTSTEVVVFSDSISFSHQLSEVPTVNNVYTVYPRVGEVWALYSKFRFDLTCSDLKKCEYNIVEILEVVDVNWIIVSVLERVNGFKTVFKAKEKERLNSTAAIPWIELYRFSHQVPAFMLSGARYGKLRGCWELDPRSLAVH